MKLFVTGGTGFIGSYFLRAALAAGHEVAALRRQGSRPRIALSQEPRWIEKNLEEVSSSDFQQADVLVHLAAHGVDAQAADWPACFEVNVAQSLHCWREAVQAGVKKLLICGSCFEYGRSAEKYDFIPVTAPLEPTGPYHASKAAATMAALGLAVHSKTPTIIFRPFHVYGEGEAPQRFWPQLRAAALSGADFPMSEGHQMRDFIAAEKVAEKILSLAAHSLPEPDISLIVNVGSGQPKRLIDFARERWTHWDAKGKIIAGALPYRENEVMRYVPLL